MKLQWLTVSLVVACSSNPPLIRPASSIVMSPDDTAIYVADTDNNQVVVVDATTLLVKRTVAVGSSPERLQVGADGRVYVSNRQSRSVSVVDPGSGQELRRIPVGTEPLGLAMTSDGATLAVVNHTSNSVSVIDVMSLAVTNVITLDPVRGPPMGAVFVTSSKLYVTHDRTGLVSIVDPATGSDLVPPLSLAVDPSQVDGDMRVPGQPTDPVLSNGVVLIALQHASTSLVVTTPAPALGAYAVSADAGTVPVVASGIGSIEVSSDTVLHGAGLEVFGNTNAQLADGGFGPAPPVIMTTLEGTPMSGPSSFAVETSGNYMYVTNMNSANVAVLATNGSVSLLEGGEATDLEGVDQPVNIALPSNGVLGLISVGNGPKGIAIPQTSSRAFIYNSLEETMSVLTAPDGMLQETSRVALASVAGTSEIQHGRQLFFSADDPRMANSQAGGVACSSCHPNGRTDGHTWLFSEGPRNTPTLAGRHLLATVPYQWDGLLATPEAFTAIVTRMGGTGEEQPTTANLQPLTSDDFQAIFTYLDSLPAPDNPNLNPDGTPVDVDAVTQGQALFTGAAMCASCHVSSTDYQDFGFHNVGTEHSGEVFPMGVNTPPLHGLFYSAPYLHDGSLAALSDVVANDESGLHGQTSALTAQQQSDLTAFLNTL